MFCSSFVKRGNPVRSQLYRVEWAGGGSLGCTLTSASIDGLKAPDYGVHSEVAGRRGR